MKAGVFAPAGAVDSPLLAAMKIQPAAGDPSTAIRTGVAPRDPDNSSASQKTPARIRPA